MKIRTKAPILVDILAGLHGLWREYDVDIENYPIFLC
jgi:hypothetical protein